jgi:hypothetical protein
VDDLRYTIRFTPRRPGSIWSAVNIARVAALEEAGRMKAAGRKAFDARSEGKSRIYAYEQAGAELSAAYARELRRNKAAWTFFQARAPWYRKRMSYWVMNAKQEATRLRRLAKLIEVCADGAASAAQVMSVCTGSDILANTGLLDGQHATTFHRHFDHMAKTFPKVTVVRDQRWVQAGKLVTSAGLASGIDTALHVVANLRGVDKARSVALHLEYQWSPETGFIRGLMADQYLRMPEKPLAFDDGTTVTEQASLGDTKYWQTDYRIESPMTPAEFIAKVRALAVDDKALHVLALPDPRQLAWEYTAERGGQWRLSLKAENKQADGSYRVVAKVMRLM